MYRVSRPNHVSIRGFQRRELTRDDDPIWWDAHHAAIEQRAKEREALKPENWPEGRHLAMLRIQRSDMAKDCIAHINGVYATERDFAWLRNAELAVRPLGQRYHQLTPEGIRIAREVCFAVAGRLRLHHITYHFDSYVEHKARCTCGWHQSINRRNNNGAAKYLQERAREHIEGAKR